MSVYPYSKILTDDCKEHCLSLNEVSKGFFNSRKLNCINKIGVAHKS